MYVADVTHQEISVYRRKCKHLFIPHKKKRTKIMQNIKAKFIENVFSTSLGQELFTVSQ